MISRPLQLSLLGILLGTLCGAAYAGTGYVSFMSTLLLMNMGTRMVQWLMVAPILTYALLHVLRYTAPRNGNTPYVETTVVVLLAGLVSVAVAALVSAPAAFFAPIFGLPLFIAGFVGAFLLIMMKYQSRVMNEDMSLRVLSVSLWVAAALVFSISYLLYGLYRYLLHAGLV